MPLFKLTGNSSRLSLHLEHPIQLEDHVDYYLALIGFYSDYDRSDYNANSIGVQKHKTLNVIEVHCRLVENSYHNHDDEHHKHKEGALLYTFSPNNEYGNTLIVEKPVQRHYIRVRNGVRKIQEIAITIMNQDSEFIDNSNTTVYLELLGKTRANPSDALTHRLMN